MRKVTSTEFAEILQISKPTFLARVRRGEIHPVNKDDWQIDGEYLFTIEEVERVKELYKKPGLTVKEVAERLEVSKTRIYQLLNREDDPLPSIQHFYKGKVRHFIEEEALNSFLERNPIETNKKRQMVSKQGYGLFQLFEHPGTNQLARIIEIDSDSGIALTENDRRLTLEQLGLEGYKPVYELERKRFITSKGRVKLLFPKPNQIKATAFQIIDSMYQVAGLENLRIEVDDYRVELEIKPLVIPAALMDEEMVQLLKNCVVEGNVAIRTDGSIRLSSDLEPVTTYVPSSLKEKIITRANELDMTIEEYVLMVLEKELKQ